MLLYHVDAFSMVPFHGNPAAVCLLREEKSSTWMQQVARELNLSETAFLLRENDDFRLRWFTPVTEVELCGHATLAAAHVLWESSVLSVEAPVHFRTLSGHLSARHINDWIELDFPAVEVISSDLTEPYLEALGVTPEAVFRSGEKFLIEVSEEEDVKRLAPDFEALRKLQGRGIIVTSQSHAPGVDFVSRYFAPWVGVNEDPVTGSAHCILGPYWGRKLAKNYLTGVQCSARGGTVKVKLSGERVYLAGKAVTVVRGTLENLEK